MIATAGCAGWGTGSPADQGSSTGNATEDGASEMPQTSPGSSGTDSLDDDTSRTEGSNDSGDSTDIDGYLNGSEDRSDDSGSGEGTDNSGIDDSDTRSEPEAPSEGDSGSSDGPEAATGSNESDDSGASNESSEIGGEGSQTAQLRVYIEDNTTGEYLVGANVTAVNQETGEEYAGTTEEGSEYYGNYVVFDDLPLGTYRISADGDGYTDGTRSVELTESGRQPGIELSPESPTFTMELVNAETGEPFQGSVTLTGPVGTERTQESGEDGVVSFPVNNGEYSFEIDAGNAELGIGYATTVSVEEGDINRTYRLYPRPDDVEASITVVDAETGEPIPNATVSGISPNLATPYGEATFEMDTDSDGVAQGSVRDAINEYEVSVMAEGYENGGRSMSAAELTDARVVLTPISDGGATSGTGGEVVAG